MNRVTWAMILWALVASTLFNREVVVNALQTEENMHKNELDNLLDLQTVHKDGLENTFNAIGANEGDKETQGMKQTTLEEELGEVKTKDNVTFANEQDVFDPEAIRKKLRKHRTTDILVACFFFVASIWLILATGYSIILLVLLRLQARGELDIYDENLGRVVLFNGRINLHFGFIIRRYAIQLEEDYQRQIQQQFGNSGAGNDEQQRIRLMTRDERRKAVEQLLGGSAKTLAVESGSADDKKVSTHLCCQVIKEADASKKSNGTSSPDTSLSCSEEEPVCSICLVEYEPTDSVFRSKSCPHMFHGDCLFSWLERRNNTECPCCREPLVSDDDIWDVVQRMRKEQRNKLRKENGLVHRLVKWTKLKTKQRDGQTHPTIPSVASDRTNSSASLSVESDEVPRDRDTILSSFTERNPDNFGVDNTNSRQESLGDSDA